ncbi:helix-turn-helix domain-containing protein, partial [Sphaerospermopsis reniformis]|uniref:helix-turn-helix domain-containing protein n=1 Tax=Sphaerospermopsis reniformis TaxID=531300 RepID=UPI001F207FCA
MLLGFKTQLKVNKQQRLLLAQHAGVARHAWNQGLALEGATKELKRLLDKHYSPQTLLIKWHLIANRCHHFQDQFLAL